MIKRSCICPGQNFLWFNFLAHDENLDRQCLDVVVQDVDVPEDGVTDWQDVAKKNDCESPSQKTQSWRKIAEIFVHNWPVAEETANSLFWKETDFVAAVENGNIGQDCWQDA